MSITWRENTKEFHLTNGSISYVVALLPDGSPGLVHFGQALAADVTYARLVRAEGRGFSTHSGDLSPEFCLDFARREYPTYGSGDYRCPAVEALDADGAPIQLAFRCTGHQVRPGAPEIPGLPALYAEDPAEAETLSIFLSDPAAGLEAELRYTIFRDYPVVARSAAIRNAGSRPLMLRRALSAALDLDDPEWELIQFSGAWARERKETRRRLVQGSQSVSSSRGISSAQQNPAAVLARPGTNETSGEAYSAALLYSGNFLIDVDVGSHGDTRLAVGVNPFAFSWRLDPSAAFETPQVALAYSASGLGPLSAAYHGLFGSRLARGPGGTGLGRSW